MLGEVIRRRSGPGVQAWPSFGTCIVPHLLANVHITQQLFLVWSETALMRIVLQVRAGPGEGQRFTFNEHDTFLVGRAHEAHFQVPNEDTFFSRIHFMIEVNPPLCRIMDMRSRNGTFVNGHRVQCADLNDGDLIKAGKTIIAVSVEDDSVSSTEHPAGETLWPEYAPQPTRSSSSQVPSHPLNQPPDLRRRVECPICLRPLTTGTQATLGILCTECEREAVGLDQVIPGYRLVRRLGSGTMGTVYSAISLDDRSPVAVKVIQPPVDLTDNRIGKFLREGRILQRLNHPNIVRFREMDRAGEFLFITMDLVRGTDLRTYLETRGPLPIPQAVGFVCDLLDGLQHAHDQGSVHRDVKPANMMLSEVNGVESVQVIDFGLARVYEAAEISGWTLTNDIGGTPAFMPPEQITNYRNVKPPADQYSAAATLYNLLTNYHLFDVGSNEELLLKIVLDPPIPVRKRRAAVPDELATIIHRGLAKKPGDRFRSAAEMGRALAPFRG